jgi:hypothetical protein
MANGYEVITEGTFDGSTKSVTFSSIPQTYTHLQFDFMGCSDQSGGTREYLYMTINDDTGSNYGYLGDYRNGASRGYMWNRTSTAPVLFGATGGGNSNANASGQSRLIIFDYANTTTYKVGQANSSFPDITYPYSGGWGNKWNEYYLVTNWLSTAAITKIKIEAQYATTGLLVGSTYRLGGWT